MIKHYLAKYIETDRRYAGLWPQINFPGRIFCFSRKRIGLKEHKTCELVKELKKREGVEAHTAEPYKDLTVSVNGPAVVLVVTD